MQMLGHYHITDQTKSRRIAHSSQFFQEEVSRSHRFQKRQSPVTTESNKVQIAFAGIANPGRRNNHPKTQVPTPNLGHPPSLYTSPRRVAVISSPRHKCQRTSNFHPGHPPQNNPTNNPGKVAEADIGPPSQTTAQFEAKVINDLTTAKNSILAD